MFHKIHGESLEHLVARVNGSGHFLTNDKQPKLMKHRKSKLEKAFEKLSAFQQETLILLMEGKYIWMQGYAIRRTELGFSIRSPEVEYQTAFGSCSCPDAKFREHECKHMRMLKEANLA